MGKYDWPRLIPIVQQGPTTMEEDLNITKEL